MNRAIKYRAYPTESQQALFIQTCGCIRSYWNHALADSEEFLAAAGTPFVPTPAKYKKEYPYLKEVDSMALCNAQLDLSAAWKKSFAEKKVSAPKYKSRKKNNVTSYTTNVRKRKRCLHYISSFILFRGRGFCTLPAGTNFDIIN